MASCFSCCFRQTDAADTSAASAAHSNHAAALVRSSTDWIRSKAPDLPEFKDRCRSIVSRIGKGNHNHHRRHSSADFGYDPLSYALNFDEGPVFDEEGDEAEFRYRNFSSRLPASPPSAAAPV